MTKHPNATDVHVGRRMRMRRLMLQMSQEAFATKLGVTFQQVQKYEKGVNRVSASRLQQACNVLPGAGAILLEDFHRTLPDLQCMKLLLLCGVVGTEVGIPFVRFSPI